MKNSSRQLQSVTNIIPAQSQPTDIYSTMCWIRLKTWNLINTSVMLKWPKWNILVLHWF